MSKSVSVNSQTSIGMKQSVLAGKNYIANPRFSGTTNGWSGTADKTIISGGVSLTEGTFYQKLSSYDIAVGTSYMARINVTATSGSVTFNIGTTAGGVDLGTADLGTGWTGVKFDGATDVYVTVTVGSGASISVKEVQVNEQLDLYVTGLVVTN